GRVGGGRCPARGVSGEEKPKGRRQRQMCKRNRPHLEKKAECKSQRVGALITEMIEHFFRSLSDPMGCTLHLKSKGKHDHHKAESLFKVFGRTLRQAIRVEGNTLPSSKGVL
ncbi:hypothetical protein ACEE86_20015, partial [Proteus mirabilis]